MTIENQNTASAQDLTIVGAKAKEDVYGIKGSQYVKIHSEGDNIKKYRKIKELINSDNSYKFDFFDKYGNKVDQMPKVTKIMKVEIQNTVRQDQAFADGMKAAFKLINQKLKNKTR